MKHLSFFLTLSPPPIPFSSRRRPHADPRLFFPFALLLSIRVWPSKILLFPLHRTFLFFLGQWATAFSSTGRQPRPWQVMSSPSSLSRERQSDSCLFAHPTRFRALHAHTRPPSSSRRRSTSPHLLYRDSRLPSSFSASFASSW